MNYVPTVSNGRKNRAVYSDDENVCWKFFLCVDFTNGIISAVIGQLKAYIDIYVQQHNT